MPIVTLVPTTSEREQWAAERMSDIRTAVKDEICKFSGFPQNDILVHLATCPYRNPDPLATDFVLYIETLPHETLEAMTNALVVALSKQAIRFKLTDGEGAEIWMRYLLGAWVLVKGGEIVDSVGYPRELVIPTGEPI